MWTIDQKLIAKGQKNSRSRSHSNRRRILDTEVQRCESCLRLQSQEVVEPRGPEILVPQPARPFLLLCPSPGIPSASPNLWTFTLHQNSAQTIPPLSCPLLLGCIHLDFSPPGRRENSATLTSSSHLSLHHHHRILAEESAGNNVTLSAVPRPVYWALLWVTPRLWVLIIAYTKDCILFSLLLS